MAKSNSADDATTKAQSQVKWTVMVFMGAATLRGSAPLLDAADADLAEMESVGSGAIEGGGQLNIFVQEHGRIPGKPRRGHVRDGQTQFEEVPPDDADTRGGRAVGRFISWALRRARHNPRNRAHYSLLVLWGHAYDFAFGRERTRTGAIDALDFAELSDVLQRLQQETGTPGARLDIIGFDACDLATVETACQLAPFGKFLLGSQIGIPIPGWPYDRVLGRLRRPYGRLMGPPEFGAWVVRRFCESYAPKDDPVSLSLLDLQRAPDLFRHAEFLALALSRFIRTRGGRDHLVEMFARSQTDEDRPYVDVADLCLTLVRESGDTFVTRAAAMLGDFLLGPRPPLVDTSRSGTGNRFVVEHGRNSARTARLNGISLYAPHLVTNRDFEAARDLYQNFTFARMTRWSELVHAIARSE